MAVNKKYYYLKFKENYFEQDHIRVIESMANGYEYSLIILKLYLKAVKFDGQLKINETIPYSSSKIDLLAGVLGHAPANVMHAINLAKELGVIEIIDTGEIFMKDIQNFIGHSSTEADRKREYRDKLERGLVVIKDKCPQNVPPMSPKCSPEIEIEKDINIKKKTYSENQDFLYIQNIWNKNKLTKHNPLTIQREIKKKHIDTINHYGANELEGAINNYSNIVNNEKYYFTHKYTLWDFLSRGYTKFLNECEPETNFLITKGGKDEQYTESANEVCKRLGYAR